MDDLEYCLRCSYLRSRVKRGNAKKSNHSHDAILIWNLSYPTNNNNMKVVNAEPIPIVSSLLSMSTKPTNPQRLDNSTIQRVLDDKELSGLLDEKVRDAGVHTSIGYSAVLRQFLASNEVSTKVSSQYNT